MDCKITDKGRIPNLEISNVTKVDIRRVFGNNIFSKIKLNLKMSLCFLTIFLR